MKRLLCIVMVLSVMFWSGQLVLAGEHGGKEHGGQEHGGDEHSDKEHGGNEHGGQEHGGKEHGGEAEGSGEHKGSRAAHEKPSADDIRETMKSYVMAKSDKTGTFDIQDTETNETRRLALVRVHERVGKTGDYYYSCADFTDVDSGELLDLDLDVEDENGDLSVVDVRIHKLNGEERYTYDENDDRIPL